MLYPGTAFVYTWNYNKTQNMFYEKDDTKYNIKQSCVAEKYFIILISINIFYENLSKKSSVKIEFNMKKITKTKEKFKLHQKIMVTQ